MAQLTKCKCGNYLSDCSCVITKMDLINEPTMKEQATCLKCGEYLRPECLEDGDTICIDCVYEIPDYEKQNINLATMKEPMKRYFGKEKPTKNQIIGFKAYKAFYPEIGVYQTFDNGIEEVYIPSNDDVEQLSEIEYWFEVPQINHQP